jgi:hypothetical protein
MGEESDDGHRDHIAHLFDCQCHFRPPFDHLYLTI